MRNRLLAVFLLCSPGLLAHPREGDSRAAIEKELGKPASVQKSSDGSVTCLYLEMGTIRYKNGKAVALKIKSEKEIKAKKEEVSIALEKLKKEKEAAEKSHYELIHSLDYRCATLRQKIIHINDFMNRNQYPEMKDIRDDIKNVHDHLDAAIKAEVDAKSAFTKPSSYSREKLITNYLDSQNVRTDLEQLAASAILRFEQYGNLAHARATGAPDPQKRAAPSSGKKNPMELL